MTSRKSRLIALGVVCATLSFAQTSNGPSPWSLSKAVNNELPSWLRLNVEERGRFEALDGSGFKPGTDRYWLNRLRLGLDIRVRSWLKFSFEAQDSRVYGQNTKPAPASQRDPLDLRIGYVELGSTEGPIDVKLGRQAFTFGEGRVLSDPNWSNVGRTFDGERVALRRGKVKLELFSGLVTKPDGTAFDEPNPGSHFHGAYGTLSKLIPGASIEPYLMWRLEHNLKSEAGRLGNMDEKTVGVRWVGKLPLGFDYGSELALQKGMVSDDSIHAWAGHWVVGHTLDDPTHRPRFFSEFNRASGDGNSRDHRHGAFDPLFPSTHDKLGLTDAFTWTNLLHWRSGFEYTFRPAFRVALAYNSFWLADARDGLYAGGKLLARRADGSAGTHVGQQADMQAYVQITRLTQINAGYGHLFPGEFLHQTTPGKPFHLMFCNISQRF